VVEKKSLQLGGKYKGSALSLEIVNAHAQAADHDDLKQSISLSGGTLRALPPMGLCRLRRVSSYSCKAI